MLLKTQKTNVKKEPIRPECILVCLYFICLPFTVVTTPFGSLLKLITIPIAIIMGFRLLIGKVEFTFNYIHFAYAIYILYTLSLLLVYRKPIAVVTTKDMILGLLMMIMVSIHIYNQREKEFIESAWLIVGIVCIVIALTTTEVLNQYESRVVIRILGFEEDQNHFCAYFIMSMLISVKRFQERRRFYPAYILIIILSFYSILKTGSRGGLIGVLAGLIVYVLLGIKSIKSRIFIIFASVLIGIIVVTVLLPSLPEDVQQRYSITAVKEDSASGRFEIWGYLLRYTASSPRRMLRGAGLLSSYEILPAAGFQNGVAHNAYIQILSDSGIVGLLLFCMVIAACLIRNIGRQQLYVCAFISILAFSMSLTFYVFKPYLNIMIMCAMSFENTLPEDKFNAIQKGVKHNV